MRLRWLKLGKLQLLLGGSLLAALIGTSMVLTAWGGPLRTSKLQQDASDGIYQGTDLGGQLASGFRLVDQSGQRKALADFRGKVVVLTFLDPNCTDACPLTAFNFKLAAQALADSAAKVVFLAVNANPEASSIADVAAATEKWGLKELQNFHFLTGEREELEPVWRDYKVTAGDSKPGKPGEVEHTPGVFLIDQEGRRQRYISVPFGQPGFRPLKDILVEQIQALLKG